MIETTFGELAADRYGDRADERPPLVLLHGLTYDRRHWGPLVAALADREPGRRVVAFDLPGHGGSPRRETYCLDEVARLVHEAVTDAGLDAPVVVGHSIGGVVATIYGATYPARGVVNIDQPLSVGGFADLLRRSAADLRGPHFARVWASLRAGMGVDQLPPAARRLIDAASTPDQDLLLGYWHELLFRPAAELTVRRERELATIRSRGVGYHHVAGVEPDPAYQRWLVSALPDVAVSVVAGGGHFPHVVRPTDVAELLAGDR
ncbi:alpha/beta fold hydrolase [Asanoa sp. WMMD1127]|uniref:alpha/beta fold hydrolase n=1 Tax=Asanoa sp. WMMD1127 TaxID=3016107 RepID=UPI002417D37C|nr:alpha/beta fold hydrolase [Asanoa sp. WMMD1127]MDG4825191.1 alpha/beta fold hydrolase [Asanoa sp. WMMD1127]